MPQPAAECTAQLLRRVFGGAFQTNLAAALVWSSKHTDLLTIVCLRVKWLPLSLVVSKQRQCLLPLFSLQLIDTDTTAYLKQCQYLLQVLFAQMAVMKLITSAVMSLLRIL